MKILGISAFYHDSAASLIQNGDIIAAAQEERFSRKKHDLSFPINAIKFCLESTSNKISDIDYIAFYDKPLLKFERLIETYLSFAPRGFTSFKKSMPIWIKEKLFQKNLIAKELGDSFPEYNQNKKLLFAEHHQSHAASAFYPSPFDEAVVLTMDGVGEWATTSVYIGKGNRLDITKEINFPHSIGLLYSAFTFYLGFKVNSGEYKLMGLSPYGKPKFVNKIYDNLLELKEDGSFRLNLEYFDYCTGLTMTNNKFNQLFGGPCRKEGETITQKHMDIAASIQKVIEEVVLKISSYLAKQTKIKNLCLAGGVALNCVANGKLLESGIFKNLWIQPAAGDAGGSLGAALAAYYSYLEHPRIKKTTGDTMNGSLLGPSYKQKDIESKLKRIGANFITLTEEQLYKTVAKDIAKENVIGWFQGKMEFGPRALGNRSILADPRSAKMQKVLNMKIKYRESFRPFAPVILREKVSNWFNLNVESPYMLIVAKIIEIYRIPLTKEQSNLFGIDRLNVPLSKIPAVTHVDYSARIQTVSQKDNPRFYNLIKQFDKITNCPILINTSFNIRGEPIVCTPEDAFRCFMGTDMDSLAIGNCYLKKVDQDANKKLDYKNNFSLD